MASLKIKYDKIMELLFDHPQLREDVNFLICRIWEEQSRELGLTTKEDIFNAICNRDLWNAETIRRTRRFVVRDYPELAPSLEVQERHRQIENMMRAHKRLLG